MPNIFDPILPTIKKSKARWASYKSTCDRNPGGPLGTPEYNEWHNEEARRRMGASVSRHAWNSAGNASGGAGVD